MKRRTLLTTGALAGAGAAWTSMSSSWSARFLRDRFEEWGKDVPAAPHTPQPSTWNDNAVTLAWLGHATVLVNFYGMRILTDPVLFPGLASTCWWAVSVRFGWSSARSPPKRFHPSTWCWCRTRTSITSTRRRCRRARKAGGRDGRGNVRPAAAAPLFVGHRAAVERIDDDPHRPRRRAGPFNRGQALGGADPARHPSRLHRLHRRTRGPQAADRGGHARNAAFRSHRRFGPFDAAVMPIGAYDPWIRNHCTPEQAVAMADAAGARAFLPVHHQCFQLSREPFENRSSAPRPRCGTSAAGSDGGRSVKRSSSRADLPPRPAAELLCEKESSVRILPAPRTGNRSGRRP